MTQSLIKPSFASGELSPRLWGRVDMEKFHTGASVARNMFVDYRGGMSSRAGFAMVGACLQQGVPTPPRLIPFQFSVFQSYILEFGDFYMRVIANGGYVTNAPEAITGITQTSPCVVTIPSHGYTAGVWIFISGVNGMTQLNGQTVVVQSVVDANRVTIGSPFTGAPINSTNFAPYVSGGTAAAIYTLNTPYAAVDLPYLKWVQSASVMSLCCVNQQTGVDYSPQELTRFAANNFTLTPLALGSSIAAPTGTGAVASTTWTAGHAGPVSYGYVVTAVGTNGQESVASNIGIATNSVDIAAEFGTITVSWSAVAGAGSYNIYKAVPDYTNSSSFVGQFFGYVGSTTSNALSWQDTNIISDFTVTPPLHLNPFATSGNFPSVVGYFQSRRVYAGTLNNPDTYFFSQTGAYSNFDSADPPIDSDAIVGTPWGEQVNGIQWLQPMTGGLIVATGLDAWQLSGTGGAGTAITPAAQNAQPQESNGFSPTVPPIKINYDLIYLQTFGTRVFDLQYSFFTNVYAGVDISFQSDHLFGGFEVTQWAWARDPFRVLWCVRNDGKMVALTFLKEQQIIAWTRHDTNGLVQSVAVASEPPVNAVYTVVSRYIIGIGRWVYFTERMDNRQWTAPEDPWCVDCALAFPQTAPNAILTASSATGPGNIDGGYVIVGGSGYSPTPSAQVIDPTGNGSGATIALTVVSGVITGFVILAPGANYQAVFVKITDPTGSGGGVALTINQAITLSASATIFDVSAIGDVVRMGGGIMTLTGVITSTVATANITVPIVETVTDDPNNMPLPAQPGEWTIARAVSTLGNLNHLEGMQVSALVDGNVVQGLTVVNGSVTLPNPGTSIKIGLPYIAQLQSLHLEAQGGPTIQGKRKRVSAVTVRVEKSRGVQLGANQPVAATEPYQEEIPWTNMSEIPDRTNQIDAGVSLPLFTGDHRVNITDDWMLDPTQASPGFLAAQQTYPLPLNVLALVPEFEVGDQP